MIYDNSEDEGRRYCQLRSGDASADPLPRFHYKPLESRCIRILELQPGQRSDSFQGKLIVTDVDSDFEYDALSYMWGEATQADRVVVDGTAIPIAWNLARALEYLRDFKGPEPLSIWIDAICIDQDDFEERAEQVAMMRSIYRNANCVRIWINESSLDKQSEAVAALKSFQYDPEAENHGLGGDISFWDPVVPIFKNGYWSRVWIQQELLNARQLMLHCMDVALDGVTVTDFWQTVDGRFRQTASIDLDYQLHLALSNLAGSVNRPSPWEMFAVHGEQRMRHMLVTLLNRSSGMQVSMGHDRPYAFMHLAEDYEEGSIIVDYNKTEEQVMADAAAYHISQHRNLEFLHKSFQNDVQTAADFEPNEAIGPTWIPNRWMGHETQGWSIPEIDRHHSMTVKGPGLMITKCSPHPVDVGNLRLRVRGVKVDWVRQCLVFNQSVDEMTAAQFWASSLGRYIQPYLSNTGTSLFEILHLAGADPWNPGHQHKDVHLSLYHLLEISKKPENADRVLGFGASEISDLLAPLEDADQGAVFALRAVLRSLRWRSCILTDNKNFGLIPDCNIRYGDEIWLVLGCSRPLVVRRQPSGRYWHTCTARVRALEEHEDLAHFKSDIQPGDKVGKWTVEDIELD